MIIDNFKIIYINVWLWYRKNEPLYFVTTRVYIIWFYETLGNWECVFEVFASIETAVTYGNFWFPADKKEASNFIMRKICLA